jgi:hypothetical protein
LADRQANVTAESVGHFRTKAGLRTLVLAALAFVPVAQRLRGVNQRPAGARRPGVGLASGSQRPGD